MRKLLAATALLAALGLLSACTTNRGYSGQGTYAQPPAGGSYQAAPPTGGPAGGGPGQGCAGPGKG